MSCSVELSMKKVNNLGPRIMIIPTASSLVKASDLKNITSIHWEYALVYTMLTLKAPITTAADDKFCDIFPNF